MSKLQSLFEAETDWQEGLSKMLRGTDIVLIIFSKISSRIPFLLAESGAALGMFREQGRPLLIPILIDDIELPSPLSQIKNIRALDRNVDKIVAEVIESLGKLVGNLKAREEQKHEVERLLTLI
jgi:TIR domain-containing protein